MRAFLLYPLALVLAVCGGLLVTGTRVLIGEKLVHPGQRYVVEGWGDLGKSSFGRRNTRLALLRPRTRREPAAKPAAAIAGLDSNPARLSGACARRAAGPLRASSLPRPCPRINSQWCTRSKTMLGQAISKLVFLSCLHGVLVRRRLHGLPQSAILKNCRLKSPAAITLERSLPRAENAYG